MQLNEIQHQILTKLLKQKEARYSELKPDKEIENDLYNYHLQYLVKCGLIEKEEKLYSLSQKGKYYLHEVYPTDALGNHFDKFRACVLLVIFKKTKKGLLILNQKRTRHPFYGDSGVVGGSIQLGEPVLEAADRTLRQNTGLEMNLSFVGIVRKTRVLVDELIFNDLLLHTFVGEYTEGKLIEESKLGINSWVNIDQAIKVEANSNQGGQGLNDLFDQLKSNRPEEILFFYKEERVKLTQPL